MCGNLRSVPTILAGIVAEGLVLRDCLKITSRLRGGRLPLAASTLMRLCTVDASKCMLFIRTRISADATIETDLSLW